MTQWYFVDEIDKWRRNSQPSAFGIRHTDGYLLDEVKLPDTTFSCDSAIHHYCVTKVFFFYILREINWGYQHSNFLFTSFVYVCMFSYIFYVVCKCNVNVFDYCCGFFLSVIWIALCTLQTSHNNQKVKHSFYILNKQVMRMFYVEIGLGVGMFNIFDSRRFIGLLIIWLFLCGCGTRSTFALSCALSFRFSPTNKNNTATERATPPHHNSNNKQIPIQLLCCAVCVWCVVLLTFRLFTLWSITRLLLLWNVNINCVICLMNHVFKKNI